MGVRIDAPRHDQLASGIDYLGVPRRQFRAHLGNPLARDSQIRPLLASNRQEGAAPNQDRKYSVPQCLQASTPLPTKLTSPPQCLQRSSSRRLAASAEKSVPSSQLM